ncbi:MAG: YceI family protein [Actinomycetota bacterium]|nr:YceI family protein [Actinomycetota bacterium]
MAAMTTTTIPGYVAGTWDIDPVRYEVSFTVRHLTVSRIGGRFAAFTGEIVTDGRLTVKGGTRAGFTATTTINRSDFGVDIVAAFSGQYAGGQPRHARVPGVRRRRSATAGRRPAVPGVHDGEGDLGVVGTPMVADRVGDPHRRTVDVQQ